MANEKILVDLILNDKDFQKGIKEAVKDTQKMGKEGKSSTDTLTKGFRAVGGAIAAMGIFNLVRDLQKVAAESQSVSSAFRNSFANAGRTLETLKEATGGTVSNLSLMQKALNAKNLKIPIDTLNAGLRLARQRASETGESVEFLAQSVVLGLGRESALILDNLGISAKRLAEETAKTGDFMKAAADIINSELKNAPPTISTLADKMGQANAEIENMKEELANELTPVFITLQKEALTFANMVKRAFGLDAEFKILKSIADQAEKMMTASEGYAKDLITIHGSAEKAAEVQRQKLKQLQDEYDVLTLVRRSGVTLSKEQLARQNELTQELDLTRKSLEWLVRGFKNMGDETPGAIEALNKKIATQKELINAAAEKDLPALNFQLQLMQEKLSQLQSIGTVTLPSFDTSTMQGRGIQTDTSYGSTKGSGREPIGKVNDLLAKQIELYNAGNEAAFQMTSTLIDGMVDASKYGETWSDKMRAMIQNLIIQFTGLIAKAILFQAIMSSGVGATGFGAFLGFGSRLGRNASGTNNFGGGLTLVGEYGPELVSLPRGSSIASASKTAGMMGGGNQLYGRLQGEDIFLSNQRYQTNRQR